MSVTMEVDDDVLGLIPLADLFDVAEAVQRRAASLPEWGRGQTFVDDYRMGEGILVRFAWSFGADRVRVGLKDG